MRKDAWTPEEDKELVKCIENSPQNIREACRQFIASHPDRTFAATHNRWHKKLRDETNVCFMTLGKKKYNRNRKVVIPIKTSDNTQPVRRSKWRRILDIIFE